MRRATIEIISYTNISETENQDGRPKTRKNDKIKIKLQNPSSVLILVCEKTQIATSHERL